MLLHFISEKIKLYKTFHLTDWSDGMNWFIVFLGLMGVLGVFILILFLIDTINHLGWLREREKYWDDMKKKREEG